MAFNFHEKCDGHSNTITFIKVGSSDRVFGGFSTKPWSTPEGKHGSFCHDDEAFIFSLSDEIVMEIQCPQNATFHYKYNGPCFGDDIVIKLDANTHSNTCPNFGHTFKLPKGLSRKTR